MFVRCSDFSFSFFFFFFYQLTAPRTTFFTLNFGESLSKFPFRIHIFPLFLHRFSPVFVLESNDLQIRPNGDSEFPIGTSAKAMCVCNGLVVRPVCVPTILLRDDGTDCYKMDECVAGWKWKRDLNSVPALVLGKLPCRHTWFSHPNGYGMFILIQLCMCWIRACIAIKFM